MTVQSALRTALSALVLATAAFAATRDGFLADNFCIDGIIAPDGANMITSPVDHSVGCALLTKCKTTGFVLLDHPPFGAKKYGPMINLTDAGNTNAITWLETQTASTKNLYVRATGTVVDGKFNAVSFAHHPTVTKRGYLTDILCVDRRTALDGADMVRAPQDHSVHCALLDVCVKTGFTILAKPAAGATDYAGRTDLTPAANDRAVAFLRKYSESRKDLLVDAVGPMDGTKFDALEFQLVNDPNHLLGGPVAIPAAVATVTAVLATLVMM